MSFEQHTDEGPNGRESTFTLGKAHQPLGVAFMRITNPKAGSRLKRTTYGTTASSTSPFLGAILDVNTFLSVHSSASNLDLQHQIQMFHCHVEKNLIQLELVLLWIFF